MKMCAGWKLNRRKPAHAPASAPASWTTSIWSLPAAAISNVRATMNTTPAARPSTPSRKLTVFCIPNSQNRLTGIANQPRSTTVVLPEPPDPGNPKYLITKPNPTTATKATSSWNANLMPGLTDQRSSAIRSTAARPDTTSTPVLVVVDGTNIKTATAKPTNMASPPSSGVGVECAWRPPGTATMPVRLETRIANGTSRAQAANATSSGQSPGRTLSRRVSRKVMLKKSDN